MKDYPPDHQQRLSLDDPAPCQDNKPLCQTERVRRFDTTKETLDKRVSKSEIQTRESSPLREATSSRSESRKAETGHQASQSKTIGQGKMLSEVRIVFPKRQLLYSMDGFGRRSEIEVGHMSEGAYQALLAACQNPMRFDGPPQDYDLTAANETPFEIPDCCKLGPETGLPLPKWWKLPAAGASEEDIWKMIHQNLERAECMGNNTSKSWSGWL